MSDSIRFTASILDPNGSSEDKYVRSRHWNQMAKYHVLYNRRRIKLPVGKKGLLEIWFEFSKSTTVHSWALTREIGYCSFSDKDMLRCMQATAVSWFIKTTQPRSWLPSHRCHHLLAILSIEWVLCLVWWIAESFNKCGLNISMGRWYLLS